MAKHAPQLPIEVDSETGVWTTDALPMLYVPRHFFVNNHMGIEEVLGADAYAEILYKTGFFDSRMTSSEVLLPTWERSHMMPTRFISATISRPKPESPPSRS